MQRVLKKYAVSITVHWSTFSEICGRICGKTGEPAVFFGKLGYDGGDPLPAFHSFIGISHEKRKAKLYMSPKLLL